MSGPTRYSRYTVGWICAIHKEYVAAKAFLDEEHDRPQTVAPNDINAYTLGKIGEHNVVISALPDGEYGTSAAAIVATNLVRTFHNVRIGFMVGIGGGVPSAECDIRLGDVVVGSPSGGHTGVFQYDFGKAVQGQGFQYTGSMNLPPQAVRTHITDLRAQYDLHGSNLDASINAALDRFPRLRNGYKRPCPGQDRLYQSWVVHGETCCQGLDEHDESKLILRNPRTKENDNPAIHYGLIASGNQLMKDATLRDAMSREHKVLCFEMEAAGMVNSFPCLVVRGICDYADSHKNDRWQGYSAMAAAAFAKDLLKQIPVEVVNEEKAIADILSDVENTLKHIQTVTDTNTATVEAMSRRALQKELHAWLNAPDTSANYTAAVSRRMQNSGLWFINHERFKKWKWQRNSFLLLCGIAGCGKTLLSSAIIDHLRKIVSPRLIYFYFDFRDKSKQTLEAMLRSLIHQLIEIDDAAQKDLEAYFRAHADGMRQPSLQQLSVILIQILKRFEELWVVLDALDESDTRPCYQTERVLSWLKSLVTSQPTNVHVLATSRLDGEVEVEILRWAGDDGIFSIQNDSALDDIRQYVREVVRKHRWFERWHCRPDVQEEIESRLMERADGLFLLVACHLERLKDCLNYPMLQKALESIPTTLCETYTQVLRAIPAHFHANAVRVLQLLTYSNRPLKAEEVVDAIAVDLSANPQFKKENRIPIPEEISRFCPNLVIVTSRKDIFYPQTEIIEFRLAHSSVKEYILSEELDAEFAPFLEDVFAQTAIASVCIAYLLQFDHTLPAKEIDTSFPFARYSAAYWIDHASNGNEEDENLSSMAMHFFLHTKGPYFDQIHQVAGGMEVIPAVYYASAGGLQCITQSLIKEGVDVNQEGGKYGNALQAASLQGHVRIVRLLLGSGANVNAFNGAHGYALHAACLSGNLEILHLLLDNGADPDTQNALHAALEGGHEHIARFLLDLNVDANNPGARWDSVPGDSPLYIASKKGQEAVVRMLLERDADPDDCSGCHSFPLMVATHNGHKEVVRLLLEYGADTEVEDGDEGTPLHIACKLGYMEIVELLLDKGANIDAKDEYGNVGTPFQVAFGEGHSDIVKLLMARGADINGSEGQYGNALCTALLQGNKGLAQELLDNGADIEREDSTDGTPLQAACFYGEEDMVQLLLDRGANVNGVDREMRTALHTACSEANERIVEILLARGVDINIDGSDSSLLEAACKGCNDSIVKRLLDKYIDLNAPRELYNQALLTASGCQSGSIVRILLDRGADVNALTRYSTPLVNACSYGKEEIVRLLLGYGADPDLHTQLETPLAASCGRGHYAITQALIDSGADVNIRVHGKTALEKAIHCGKAEIIRLLLEKGVDALACKSALRCASAEGNLEFVKILLHHGTTFNTEDCAALFDASAGGHHEVVRQLLDKGANPNSTGRIAYTDGRAIDGNALYIASKNGHTRVVQHLLDRGADLNVIYGAHGNALFVATLASHSSVVEKLLDYGANPDIGGVPDWIYGYKKYPSALYAACANGNRRVVDMLLSHRANPHAVYEGYGNVLFVACFNRDVDIVRTLIKYRVDMNVGGFDTHRSGIDLANALQAASAWGSDDIIHMLLDNGADINTKGGYYGTALQVACAMGRESKVILLLDRGADINAQCGHYGNAVQAALGECETRLAKILLRRGAFIDPDGPGYKNAFRCAIPQWKTAQEALQILKTKAYFMPKGQKRRYSDIAPLVSR